MNWSSETLQDKIVNVMEKLGKYKIYILVSFVVIVLGIIVLIPKKSETNKYIEIIGSEVVKLSVGSTYEELGFKAYDDNNKSYEDEVIIETNLDVNTPGEYQIKYKLEEKEVVRTVIVLEKPEEYYKFTLEKVNEEETIYLKLGEEYKEPGFKIEDEKGNDITSTIVVDIEDKVDSTKVGKYEIIYKYKSKNNKEIIEKRNVIVIDNKLEVSLDNDQYTNTSVKVNIKVTDEYFDYMLMPSNEKIKKKEHTYSIDKNGVYKFVLYNKKGLNIEKTIEIKNIDKEKPTSTCEAIVQNGKTTVKINASDNIGIQKYIIGQNQYTTNEITLSGEKNSVSVDVYDKANNKQSIVCKKINKDIVVTLSKSTTSYTKNDVNITVNVESGDFDYTKLPNGNKVYSKKYTYKASKNDIYKFEVYDKDGTKKELSIVVDNIDKELPTGSCSGSYKDGVSTININASDNIGISKYVINGTEYTTKNITINKEIDTLNVTIYDKVGNTKNISCTLKDKNEFITSSPNITFSYEYIKRDDTMPYGLFTPSNIKSSKQTPLIIWLHGSGERGVNPKVFEASGFLNVLKNWTLEGFNAYVICPHLAGSGYSKTWNNETSRTRLNTLIQKIKQEKNILSNKIILVGHSLGGQGVLYMTGKDNFYSAAVTFSGYAPGVDISKINTPMLGYVGKTSYGEDSDSYSYMNYTFKSVFGNNNLFVLNSSHGTVPKMAFNQDNNNDNKSDLIEWMLNK